MISLHYLIISSASCLILQCKNVGFVKGKCSGKNKKRFHVKSAILGFIKNVLNSQEKILNKLVSKKINSLCQPCFHKDVPFGSPKNNKNLKTYSHMNITIIPRSTKTKFYNNCNSIEVPFDDSDHHTFINSKYYDIY